MVRYGRDWICSCLLVMLVLSACLVELGIDSRFFSSASSSFGFFAFLPDLILSILLLTAYACVHGSKHVIHGSLRRLREFLSYACHYFILALYIPTCIYIRTYLH
ncbi:hypothetical protein F4813DRAFT_341885 [Daldinia decipiens]|uniref:uncharacterized protein n=1 Tax=Daldinia decipiens TaxID=326647 RepID=UPI0020C4A7F5|nr:uncharacterized protein F4813DRAFT_341885 [Daldinia decipiens]KAI1662772.1 hypothetical protein F4813DRAFT_341885 [Daldinia decipiens]